MEGFFNGKKQKEEKEMKDLQYGLFVPEGYKTELGLIETEVAIKKIKDFFQMELAKALELTRVSAPLFVTQKSGLNDNLNGIERPVAFDMIDVEGETAEIVQSLAKWKRWALGKYGFEAGKGLYTDMNAIRRDEVLDNIHSIYVDQWDWEKVITKEQRKFKTLKETVKEIYMVFKKTEEYMYSLYPSLGEALPEEIFFITSQELEDRYPGLTAKDREDAITKEKKAVFVSEIGHKLKSGTRHDGRAPDYDDWRLNGDILFWNPMLEMAYEVSSMGIRVDEDALEEQLMIADAEDRKDLPFHKDILEGNLPYTVGGGIGQSRICMFFLKKAHIGEVQASIWPEAMLEKCEEAGIKML
jgi:aspartate--ammonia ligase